MAEKQELFVKNYSAIAKKFSSEENFMCVSASLLHTIANQEVDVEKMAECKKILKKQTGFFSNFRAMLEVVILSKMAQSKDPEQYVLDLKSVYDKLRDAKFKENSYMVLASLIICDYELQNNCDEMIGKAKEIMDRMEKEHPLLTSSEDMSFVMLLALSYKDVDAIMKDFAEGYEYLRTTYRSGVSRNATQSLCEILAISYGDIKEKCDRVMRIHQAFRKHKYAYGNDNEFCTLGALADVDRDPEALAGEIMETAEYLKGQEGFGDKKMERSQRLMYATLLVADSYGRNLEVMNNPAINNAIGIITAQRMAKTISVLVNVAANVIPALMESKSKTEEDTPAESK